MGTDVITSMYGLAIVATVFLSYTFLLKEILTMAKGIKELRSALSRCETGLAKVQASIPVVEPDLTDEVDRLEAIADGLEELAELPSIPCPIPDTEDEDEGAGESGTDAKTDG